MTEQKAVFILKKMGIRKVHLGKLREQLVFINKWIGTKDKKGTWEAATGLGKTWAACLIAVEFIEKFNAPILVVTPKITIKDQWENMYIKRIKKVYPNCNIDTIVINSLVSDSYIRKKYGMVIWDEIHNYLMGDVFSKGFRITNSPCNIGLSASINQKEREVINSICPILCSINRTEAESKGVINPVTLYNILIPLGPTELMKLEWMNREMGKIFSFFPDEHYFTTYITNKNLVNDLARKTNVSAGQITGMAIKGNNLVRQRAALFEEHKKKLEFTREIFELYNNEKIITFNNSTKICDDLTRMYPDQSISYHSNINGEIYLDKKIIGEIVSGKRVSYEIKGKRYEWNDIKKLYPGVKKRSSKKTKEDILRKFSDNRYKLRILNTAEALKEGLDVSSMSVGVRLSRTSSARDTIQTIGRVRGNGVYFDMCLINLKSSYLVDGNLKKNRTITAEEFKMRSCQEKANVIFQDKIISPGSSIKSIFNLTEV